MKLTPRAKTKPRTTTGYLRAETPIRLRRFAEDLGMVLAHDLKGEPLHWVHEVEAPEGGAGEPRLSKAGYRRRTGRRIEGRQYWTWTRCYPVAQIPELDEEIRLAIAEEQEHRDSIACGGLSTVYGVGAYMV